MRIPRFMTGAALAVALVGTSLATSLAPTPAHASVASNPFSLEMDPIDYYAYLANPQFYQNAPVQPLFGTTLYSR